MPLNKPLVSVVIPHFKRLNYTQEAIRSILGQKGVSQDKIQIVISDQENKKSTKRALQSISSNIVYTTDIFEEGPGGNRESGITKAEGEYTVCLDSDDQLKPKFLIQMVTVLKNNKECSAAMCLSHAKFEPEFSLKERIKLYPLMLIQDTGLISGYLFNNKNLYPSSFYLCQLSHMIFRTSIIKKIKFNYDYRHGGEDWDFILKNLKHGPIKIVPKRLLDFRYSPTSSTSSPINRKRKWKSYSLLASRLPNKYKRSLFYRLFLYYISLFGGNKTD